MRMLLLVCLLLAGCASPLPDTRGMTIEEKLMVIEALKWHPRPVKFYPMRTCCIWEHP